MADIEATQSNHFDIIEGLHLRFMNNILEAIFQYLDAESLRNAELTCKAWKAAAYDSNPKKLWQVLLHTKMSTSPLWERLDYCLRSKPSKLPQPSKDCWFSRKLFSKIEFTVKALQRNWLENDLTREYVDCDVGMKSCMFQMRSKFIALWEPISGIFKIWNRITLKVEEVYHGLQNRPDMEFELYENALIYSLSYYIFIRNLTTKKTEVHKPFGLETKKLINYLRAENGFLCVAAGFRIDDCNDVYIWKMTSPTQIEWENPKIIPNVSMDNSRIYLDDKFVVIAHHGTSYIYCDVYLLSEPKEKQRCLKLPRTRPELLYQDGFLLMVTDRDEIRIVNVETCKTRIIAYTESDFSRHNNFLRINSGYIFAFTSVGCSHGSRIQIWDFAKATDLTTKLPLQPICSHHCFMEPAMILHVDTFGILAVNRESVRLHERDIIWTLNFLPICSFCKQVKKRLLKCASCKSAKYCSSICQKADWKHHRDMCQKIRDHYEEKN